MVSKRNMLDADNNKRVFQFVMPQRNANAAIKTTGRCARWRNRLSRNRSNNYN